MKGKYDADVTSDYYSSVIFTDFGLQVGDLVSMLPINGGQQFIVLGKVVYCGDLTEDMFKDKHNNRPSDRLF